MKKLAFAVITLLITAAVMLTAVSCGGGVNGIKINARHKEIKIIDANIETKSVADDRYMIIDVELKLKKGTEKLAVGEFSLKLNGIDSEFRLYDGCGAEYAADGEILRQDESVIITVRPLDFALNSSGGYEVELAYGGERLLWYTRE